MVTKNFHTQIEIDLSPTYHSSVPEIAYGIDKVHEQVNLSRPTTLKFDQMLAQCEHVVIIDYLNKKDADCIPHLGLDKYITIGAIRVNGISLPRFNWLATYEPVFPEPWYSEQNPPPDPIQQGETHLGWNGRWQLKFHAPVFSWIHKIENMGWVWPV